MLPRQSTYAHRVPLAVVILLSSIAAGAWAFTLEPITRDFTASGPGATQTFRVSNTENHPIAVKISMVRREMDRNGKESYTDASDVFVVFPSQIVLKPETSQVIRVQWRGPASIDSERAFRIIAEELPVDFGGAHQQGGNINILFRYLGSVYVVPPQAAPKVALTDIRTINEPGGRHGFLVTLTNSGTSHTLLNDLRIGVTAGTGYSLTFGPKELPGAAGENLLAGHSRVFYIPVSGPLPEQNLHAEISFDATR
ncbi:fimbrial biogenesis chaperone [Salinispira pacifica]